MNKKILIYTLLIFLAFTSYSYAADPKKVDIIIYSWGQADILAKMLNATSKLLASSGFNVLYKVSALIGIFVVLSALFSDKPINGFALLSKIILIIIIPVLLSGSKSTVLVQEQEAGVVGPGQTTVVDNVPRFLSLPLELLTSMEKGLREIFSKTLGGELIGAGGGVSVIKSLNLISAGINYRVNDTNFLRTLQSYTYNCIVPDIYTGRIDPHLLESGGTTKDPWEYIKNTVKHPGRVSESFLGNNAGSSQTLKPCVDIQVEINQALNKLAGEAYTQIRAGLGYAVNNQAADEMGTVAKALFNYQQSGANLIKTNMSINAIKDSFESISSSVGIASGGLGYGTAKATETMKTSSVMSAINAKKYLPVAKGYLTVIFVALIPLIILIGLATSNFRKPFAMVFGMLLALALWGIGEQILDFIISVRAQSAFGPGYSYDPSKTLFVNGTIMDSIYLSLGMYWMIPTLAFSIATMSGYSASTMMSSISGIASTGVSSAASEVASGSASFGTVRGMSYNMNKYDAANNLSVGGNRSHSIANTSKADTGTSAVNSHDLKNSTSNINTQLDEVTSTYRFGQFGERGGAVELPDGRIVNGKVSETNGMFTVSTTDENGKLVTATVNSQNGFNVDKSGVLHFGEGAKLGQGNTDGSIGSKGDSIMFNGKEIQNANISIGHDGSGTIIGQEMINGVSSAVAYNFENGTLDNKNGTLSGNIIEGSTKSGIDTKHGDNFNFKGLGNSLMGNGEDVKVIGNALLADYADAKQQLETMDFIKSGANGNTDKNFDIQYAAAKDKLANSENKLNEFTKGLGDYTSGYFRDQFSNAKNAYMSAGAGGSFIVGHAETGVKIDAANQTSQDGNYMRYLNYMNSAKEAAVGGDTNAMDGFYNKAKKDIEFSAANQTAYEALLNRVGRSDMTEEQTNAAVKDYWDTFNYNNEMQACNSKMTLEGEQSCKTDVNKKYGK